MIALSWIKKNLSPYIQRAVAIHVGTFVTEDILAGIVMRETGGLIEKHIPDCGNDVLKMSSLMKGDYTQRKSDTAVVAHGFGFPQIDIDSFPWFVKAGYWKDPDKCFSQAIAILEGNKAHILSHNPTLKGSDKLPYYSVAAYNCGAGNEDAVINKNLDADAYTTGHNYSKAVFDYAATYRTL